jgi:hypothetical protein
VKHLAFALRARAIALIDTTSHTCSRRLGARLIVGELLTTMRASLVAVACALVGGAEAIIRPQEVIARREAARAQLKTPQFVRRGAPGPTIAFNDSRVDQFRVDGASLPDIDCKLNLTFVGIPSFRSRANPLCSRRRRELCGLASHIF